MKATIWLFLVLGVAVIAQPVLADHKYRLKTSAFAAAQSPVGKDCRAGTVGKLDVLVCPFATADKAKAAQDAGLQWVGDTTGSSQAKGTFLIAAADRHKADPSGKTISQIFKLATK